jgi:hypothetical protein
MAALVPAFRQLRLLHIRSYRIAWPEIRGEVQWTIDNVEPRFRAKKKQISAAVGRKFELRWTAPSLVTALFQHAITGFHPVMLMVSRFEGSICG